jgi:type IV secretion system protein VirD4
LSVRDASEGRLVLGRLGRSLIATQQHHSVIVFGPTGSGKTTALVVPALLEHNGPAIALSVKTDLVADTITRRAGIGPVFVYDPLSLTGIDGASWTPLRACTTWPEAQRMAEALTSAVGDTGLSDNRFWDTMAAKMLEALLHAAALEDKTMRHVVEWVDTREQAAITEILTRHGATRAAQSWAASQNREERTLANVYASTEVMLRAWASPSMTDCTIADSLDPATILKRKGTLYVCAPAEDQARLRPVFAALVKDMLRSATLSAEKDGPLDPSLLVVLDEAANIAPLHDLAEIAATCRAYGIQLVTVFQDLAQVTARYRTRAGTVVNNHTAKLLLPGTSDRDLLELMTRLLGEHTTHEVTHSHSTTGTSRTDSTRYRPLAAINELRQLPQDTALLLYGNLPPAKLTLRPFFNDPHLSRLAHPKDAA